MQLSLGGPLSKNLAARTADGSGRPSWWPALLLFTLSFFGMAGLSFRPTSADASIAAVFPPWWTSERAFAAAASAGDAVVREGAWSNILVIRPSDDRFAERLHAAGAWLLLNAKALDACLKETP
jgi:hypothetical protein